MVGEIRDRETADIAIQAALTGHLVLSTVHTNDAVSAITRLRDMKVEPFLIASTVRAVIAQRLVRRLCTACREAVAAAPSLARLLTIPEGAIVHEPRGCGECGGTGYKGRVGLFEAVRVDDQLRRLINAGADEDALAAHAFSSLPRLADSARALVLDGTTSPEEAVRISRPESIDA
jgi:general secretion pathway protein E